MNRFAMSGLSVALFLSAACAVEAPQLAGTWSAVAVTREGKPESAELVKSVSLTITKGELTFSIKDKKFPAKIKTDDKAKPAAIDISPTEGADSGRTFLGIWKIEKGELLIAFRERGDRPTDFKGEDGAILFRLKKDEKK
jgi:uncharacterized protein (TIGR03067 family)